VSHLISAKRRWARDIGVSELVEHFDEIERRWRDAGKKGLPWSVLNRREEEVIATEIARCRNDFSYAARNYFWIINKESKQDQLFRLWESQELILDAILRLKAQGRSQRIVLIKARQLGCSTVAEGLIAHRIIFHRNADCYIVSYDDEHAGYLFGIVQHIYDKLPWWMRPLSASREIKRCLVLDNPDPDDRRRNPGMNSMVTAKGAMATTGVGQGRALAACHLSEFADWVDAKAREIIEEDIENALADSPETFGIMESTAKGAGNYSHDFWLRMERLEDRANWVPLFLPWFFDRSRAIVVLPEGWKVEQAEADIRERASRDWVRCDDSACEQFQRRIRNTVDSTGKPCLTCGRGTMRAFTITDNQLAWMERRRENVEDDEESLNKLRQEQASTPEEAFRISGVRLFSERQLAFAQSTIMEPIAAGFIDKTLRFHGVNRETGRCFSQGCELDHSYDADDLLLWEMPVHGESYVVGGDVADGLGGKYDYSCAQVIKIDRTGGCDEQVATFASNTIDPEAFSDLVNRMGRYYNEASVATELNATAGGVCAHSLRVRLQYPNLYRPMNAGNVNLESSILGWKTTAGTKPRLYHSLRKALDQRMLKIRCKFTVTEINNFRREDESSRRMGAMVGHDDRIMALMIANAVAHERDWDEDGGTIRYRTPLTLETAPYAYHCFGCGHQWPGRTPIECLQCPECETLHIMARQQHSSDTGQDSVDLERELRFDPLDDSPRVPDYISL